MFDDELVVLFQPSLCLTLLRRTVNRILNETEVNEAMIYLKVSD